jgi:hypothetical protein
MPTKVSKTSKPRPSNKAELNGKPVPSGDEILTLDEAAAFLRVSKDGLRTEAVDGKVPGRQVAGEWRFSRVALLNWLGQLEPTLLPKLSGKALVEYIRKTGVPWNATAEREAETFIAASKATSFGE